MGSRRFSFRLTRGGKVFAALCLLTTLGAFNAGINTSYLLASLLIATGLLAAVMTLWNMRGLRCHRILDEAIYARESFEAHFRVSSARSSTAQLLLVEDVSPADAPDEKDSGRGLIWRVPPRSSVGLSCKASPLQRGVYPMPGLRLSTTFPFGFTECIRTFAAPGEIVVYPARGALNRHVTTTLTSRTMRTGQPSRSGLMNDEFHMLREYQPGDSLHRIHWRASAHFGKLCVRQMERERGVWLLVLLDSRIPRSMVGTARKRATTALDLAISCAAEVCRTAFEAGNPINLAAFFPEPLLIGLGDPERGILSDASRLRFFDMLDALARLNPSDDENASALIDAIEAGAPVRAEQVFVITPTEETAGGLPASMGGRTLHPLVATDPSFEEAFTLLSHEEGVA